MQIAQEHLIYNHDPAKAMLTITASLRGCPDDLALQIIKGDMVLPIDEDTQQVICVPREEFHTMFPKLELEDWCDKQAKEIEKHALELRDSLDRLKKQAEYKRIYKSYDYATIMKFVAGDDEAILDDLRDLEEVSEIEMLFSVTQRFIDKSMKTFTVIDWMRKSYPQEFLHADPDDYRLHTHKVFQEFKKLCGGEVNIIVEDQGVSNYIEAVRENDAIVEAGIEPVNIMDNWSAGWLSPEGEYYALNGEIANMLHIEIAKALQDVDIIPHDDNPDSWLEENGWVKIHDNHIQFTGTAGIHMNDIQKKIVYKYIQVCFMGSMRLGWKMTKISAPRFEMTEDLMLKKHYFSYD